MSYPDSIFLLDIDGVLVEPLGYRAATLATIRHFINKLGIDPILVPNLESIERFEAMHITSEWDMVPISLAIILEAILDANPQVRLPDSTSDLERLEAIQNPLAIDYLTPINYLSTDLSIGEYPAATALRLAVEHISRSGEKHPGLFPRLSSKPLLTEILTNTRNPYHSPTTRIFQHYSLGSDVFNQVYDLPVEIVTGSLLKACDEPQLSMAHQNSLKERLASGRLAAAAITNRPSYPPRELDHTLKGYPPEAEMALELNGLEHLPMVSFGRIRYLAEMYNIEPESLIKPSPVQAVAAVLAALTGREYPAMKAALHLVQAGASERTLWMDSELQLHLSDVPSILKIHIFEDTCGGIDATRLAGSMLEKSGIANTIFAWGVAKNQAKIESLRQCRASVFMNTGSAIQAALKLV